ncbi:MAG: NYN domain-containing protein [Candidatus Omnitrophica bacterium]|nr:NYN domain-containing protein [Candidatus Omnitrophota bacterium]
MSLQYLLDGYNIIHQMPEADKGSLESLRDRLAQLVSGQRPQGSLRNKVTIVFDGQPGFLSPNSFNDVKIIFSSDESADDKIKKLVEYSDNPKAIVVVTDDNGIRNVVRSLGAGVMSVKDFLNKGSRNAAVANKKTGVIQGSQDKKLSSSRERQINEEFEKRWIKNSK